MTTTNQQPSYLQTAKSELAARTTETKLRNILRINAEVTFVLGIAGVIAAGWIADTLNFKEVLGLSQTNLVRIVSAGLALFALDVFVISGLRTRRIKTWSQQVALSDFGWVAATVAAIALDWFDTPGDVLVGAVGLLTLEFAIAQWRARSRFISAETDSVATLNESPPVEIISFTRTIDADSETLWPVITNHELYAKLALNLKEASNITPNGPDFQRSCTDTLGRTWSETCTLWDDGHRFDLNIDIDEYPYPLQLVQASWSVEPAEQSPARTDVAGTFAFQPDPGLQGRIFAPIMHLTLPPILKRIAKGWARAARTPTEAQVPAQQ